jgi:hypothetical protein
LHPQPICHRASDDQAQRLWVCSAGMMSYGAKRYSNELSTFM